MAYPDNAARVVIGGTLVTGEIWAVSHGIIFDTTPSGLPDLQARADAVQALVVSELMPGSKPLMRSGDQYTGLTMYYYGSPPQPTAVNVVHSAPASPVAGTGSQQQPNPSCLVASLRSAAAGRSQRGRMYFPATGMALANGLVSTSSTCTNLANAVAGYLQGINDSTDIHGEAVVISTTRGSSVPIIGVRVDNRPDTQRRRANKLAVTFTGTASVTPG